MSLAVIGATSQIAQSVAKIFFDSGHDLLLVSRDISRLPVIRSADSSDQPQVLTFQGSVSDLESVELVAQRVISELGEDPYVLVAVGSIKGGESSRLSSDAATRIIDINYVNLVAMITPIAEALEQKGKGCLIIISSVAGDRGRQSNYVYGSAKAGLSVYAQGLRNRLYSSGVHVLTVKPGYVDTPMLRQALGAKYAHTPGILVGNTDKVGRSIYFAAMKRKNVIYCPAIWRILMFLIRGIPELVFKRMQL